MTHDTAGATRAVRSGRTLSGLGFGVLASLLFSMSGILARGPMNAGWSPAAVVTLRVGVAAVVLLPVVLPGLRRQWPHLRAEWRLVVGYGVLAIAGAQLGFFSAVKTLPVAVALLIEYLAPLVLLLWLWWRGHRPTPVMGVGAVVSLVGLVLVLGVAGGVRFDLTGVIWAAGAMLGLAAFFVLSSQPTEVAPTTLAGLGSLVATVVLVAVTASGLLEWRSSTDAASYGSVTVAWWVPFLALGTLTAAFAYLAGIAAAQRLGARMASFVSLSEVVFALVFAWWLLGESVSGPQLLGGALVLAGVVAVKYGEPQENPAALSHT